MSNKTPFVIIAACIFGYCAAPVCHAAPAQDHPNILFIIMDDVGIDQLRSFGYGGANAPKTPVLDVVARNGIRFRNVWAMPECSPSRALFFEGRYPLRTNIFTAILTTDLANSQVSPFEMTSPKVLRRANYKSALFGKFHLAGPTNNPYGNGTPNATGFDYFDGFLEGAPHPIDTTAGGADRTGGTDQFPTGPYTCGFVPNHTDDSTNGSDAGACYFADKRGCKVIKTPEVPTPGRACMEQGGIFYPFKPGGDTGCRSIPPSTLNFNLANGYYVFNLVTNDREAGTVYKHPLTDPRARMYSPIETTDAAVKWIKSQPNGQPWMATASYAAIHAPYQQAPQSLTPGEPDLSDVPCAGPNQTNAPLKDIHKLSNQMVEAMDTEIGRLLIESGVASKKPDGTIEYDPGVSNTMVVIIGDNGTYSQSVKAPFDIEHAKGWVNQTGVWVPLIVSGPLVNSPNRDVQNMVNVADLFQLFGEIAGLDVRKLVPKARIIDSVPMLPYLTNPGQASLRPYNFTQTGINISANGVRPGPCVIFIPSISPTCVQIFPEKPLCETEGGKWYGPGATSPQFEANSCCDLLGKIQGLKVLPLDQVAVRNDKFKLIEVTAACETPPPTPLEERTPQLYRINENTPTPLLDFPVLNLIKDENDPTKGLTNEQKENYLALKTELDSIVKSESQCPGDGNVDGVVDQRDIQNWTKFHKSGSSWYDFPMANGMYDPNGVYDGFTDNKDLTVIQQHLGQTCPPR
ncbi:MAG: sulfatase-like hydrolase/transferase [Acidobacteriaceae bacterium]|nr:sulfatase-like hydrolase/transferase [Acidobacteriaceae bacterium]